MCFSKVNSVSTYTPRSFSQVVVAIGVRANIHLGGQTKFCPNGFSGGGGSCRNFPGSKFSGGGGSSRNFPDPYSVGSQNCFP